MKKAIFVLCCIAALAMACRKNYDRQTPAAATGSVYGYITLRDEFGNLIKPSNVNIVVGNGTSTVAIAVSDTLGAYNIAGLAEGAYNVSFSGTNIANYQTFDRAIIGGSTLNYFGNQALYQNCTAIIDTLTIARDTANTVDIVVKGAVTTPASLPELGIANYTQALHLFFSKNPAVSSQTYTYGLVSSLSFTKSKRVAVNLTTAFSALYTAGFQSGDKVYVIGYMGPNLTTYGFTNCTGNAYPCVTTYCGLSQPSLISSFILP